MLHLADERQEAWYKAIREFEKRQRTESSKLVQERRKRQERVLAFLWESGRGNPVHLREIAEFLEMSLGGTRYWMIQHGDELWAFGDSLQEWKPIATRGAL